MSLESAVVAVIVLAFALRAARQLFPSTAQRMITRLRSALGLAPVTPAVEAARCGSGCGSCGGCDRPPSTQAVQPLQFRPRRH